MIAAPHRELVCASLADVMHLAPFGKGLPARSPIKWPIAAGPDGPDVIFGSNLKLWLRADLGITLNAGNVSAWADQSGAGNDFVQAIGGRQPPFVASGFGSRPAVSFDGSSSWWLENNSGTFTAMLPTTGHALFAVVQPQNTDADTSSWLEPAVFTDSAGNAAVLTATNNALRVSHWDGGDKSAMVAVSSSPVANYRARRRFSGSALFVNVNGGSDGTIAAGTMSSTGSNTLIGINYATTAKFKGLIGEIVAVDRDITPTEDAAMQSYLSAFWGF